MPVAGTRSTSGQQRGAPLKSAFCIMKSWGTQGWNELQQSRNTSEGNKCSLDNYIMNYWKHGLFIKGGILAKSI